MAAVNDLTIPIILMLFAIIFIPRSTSEIPGTT
ncbi:hypothetical protein Bhyg_01864 [Pseudolycoriella hygida]|uniref:Uncharacterized protein n=1 Tax=Pseudolycoriella hygida TaxID=35572 RepID=A0A9Q0NBX8_9DIPT|nr:hypothetical protein Bhyg_01864 [Pseudolycoriella hygida]